MGEAGDAGSLGAARRNSHHVAADGPDAFRRAPARPGQPAARQSGRGRRRADTVQRPRSAAVVVFARTWRPSSSAPRRVVHQPGRNQDRGRGSTSRSTQQRGGRHGSGSCRCSTRGRRPGSSNWPAATRIGHAQHRRAGARAMEFPGPWIAGFPALPRNCGAIGSAGRSLPTVVPRLRSSRIDTNRPDSGGNCHRQLSVSGRCNACRRCNACISQDP